MAFGTISVDNITFENTTGADQTVTVQSLADGAFDPNNATLTGTTTADILNANAIDVTAINADVMTAPFVTVGFAANQTIDIATGSAFVMPVSGDTTLTFTNPPENNIVTSFLLQINYTSGTITWPAAVEWPGSNVPTLDANTTSTFLFYTPNNGTTYFGSALSNYDLT